MNGDDVRKGVRKMQENKSRQEAFCGWYAMLGNLTEAAERAGFEKGSALSEGLKCLRNESCRKKIAQFRRILSDDGNVAAGLKRLAFGSCRDALYLVFADELPPKPVIDGLDLFNVSEIKRDKGGGVEVRFFDRLKALEKLYELENAFSEKDKAKSLLAALTGGESDGVDDN